jgi:hypothetical protein
MIGFAVKSLSSVTCPSLLKKKSLLKKHRDIHRVIGERHHVIDAVGEVIIEQ